MLALVSREGEACLPIAFLVVLVYSVFMVLGIKGLFIVRKPNGHYNFTIRLDIPCSRILTLPRAAPLSIMGVHREVFQPT